jgi:hypothetical protein
LISLTDKEIGYIAGLVDGEGCTHIFKNMVYVKKEGKYKRQNRRKIISRQE